MKRICILLLTLLTLSYSEAIGQLNFYFLSDVHSRQIDGLGNFQVQNVFNEPIKGNVVITVKENNSRLNVVDITTPVAVFNPGLHNFPKGLFTSSRFTFSHNALASIVSQTRNFPPGDYTFCFRFVPESKQTMDEYENCFDAAVQPLVPISLITPSNQDTMCLKRPVLSWQPPMPFHPSMRFRLLLTEKKGEGATESILKNPPLLLLDNIASSTINYPSNYPELKEGTTYYWQVVAYQQGIIISTSEVWEFTVQCNETPKLAPNDSYRELKLLANGNYYVANRSLKFSFQNHYTIKQLDYSILDISKDGTNIKHVPEVKLQSGLNKIDIDLTELNLKPGNHYILKVNPFNEPSVTIRFIYQDEDNN